MRTTVDIPDTIYREWKSRAALEDFGEGQRGEISAKQWADGYIAALRSPQEFT